MIVNKKLKEDLLKKLGISESTLSKKATALKNKLMMETDVAYYLIANESGLKLKKYLDADKMKEVVNIQNQWAAISNSSNTVEQRKKIIRKALSKTVHIKLNNRLIGKEPLLGKNKVDEAKKMTAIFSVLYILENSIRAFLTIALKEVYGDDWWEKATNRDLKKTVERRLRNEEKNPWHQKRAKNNIGYLDFRELIVLTNKVDQKLVELGVLPRRDWLKNIIEDVYQSRCVLCHMNPLLDESIQLIEASYNKWANQLRSTISLLK